jgi:hypothetical protein
MVKFCIIKKEMVLMVSLLQYMVIMRFILVIVLIIKLVSGILFILKGLTYWVNRNSEEVKGPFKKSRPISDISRYCVNMATVCLLCGIIIIVMALLSIGGLLFLLTALIVYPVTASIFEKKYSEI